MREGHHLRNQCKSEVQMVSKHVYDENIEHLTSIPPFKEDTMTKTEMQHLFQNIVLDQS